MTIRYRMKVTALKVPRFGRWWRRWRANRGDDVGAYSRLPEHVREYAPGKSFADIGCMWGVNGAYAFLAEEAGATFVKGVDVFGPTPEFEREHEARRSGVEFILGDATAVETIEQVGEVDVVLCAGVLYHHPSPFDLLAALRHLCRRTLILRTSTIPEVDGLPHAAVYWPMLSQRQRRHWDLRTLGVERQVGISGPFEPDQGYANWFWGLSPSCLVALVETAGFRVLRRLPEAFAQTLICEPVQPPVAHRLPNSRQSRRIGQEVSQEGRAKPA